MRRTRYTRWLPVACVTAGLLALTWAPLGAQGVGVVTGVVRSAEGLPISNAQIYLEGRGIGGLTNQDGRYQLQRVPAGEYIVVAEVIGYTTQRRTGVMVPAAGSVTIDFTLRTQVLGLAGLVVTGVTQATSRAMIPFTVERVSASDIVVPPANAFLAIEGKVAGARVIRGSEPGAGVNILMRTPTSVNRSTSPLMVVDGVILASSSADISTLDIESVEIVKGAAAASMYGSRAASGVIQIRTKRGSALPEDRTRFTLRSEYGMSDIPNPIVTAKYHNFLTNAQGEYLDNKGAVVPRWLATTTKYGFLDQPYTTPTWDHIKSLFRPNDFYTHSGTFGYNTGTTSWLASVSNQHEMGVVRGNDGYKRTDFRLNLDHRLRNDLSVSVSAFHMRSVTDNMYGNVFFDFVQIAPDVDLLQPDPDGTQYIFQPDPSGIRPNPLYLIVTQDRKAKRLRTMGSADLRYNPVEWLSVDLNASYDRSDRRSTTFIPKGVKTYDYGAGNPGYAFQSSGFDDAINASAGVSASHAFGRLNTRTTARALMESDNYQYFEASGDDFAVGGVPDLDALKIPSISSEAEDVRASGYLANTDLTWGDRYIVNALVRADGSSLFGPQDRWHTYYRTSAAWRMAGEPWWPFESVNEFKLRFSRGTAGGRPDFADQYEVFDVLEGGGLELSTLGNKFLRPEHSTENEIGLDIVARQRFFLQLTYASQRTTDQLVEVPLPALYGFTSQWQNAGTVEGHTLEASLEARVVDRPGLLWTLTLVGDRSRNKLVEYDRPCHQDDMGYRCAGEQIGMIYTQRLLHSLDDLKLHRGGEHANSGGAFDVNDDGVVVPVGVGNTWRDGVAKDLWGKTVTIDGRNYTWGMPFKLLDKNGNAVWEKTGDFNPDFKWGITNSVQWKDLTAYVLVDGQVGGDVYNQTKQRMYQWERHGDEVQVGKSEDTKKPSAYYVSSMYNANSAIDWFVEDGSFVKLREVSLRYRMDPSLLGRIAPANLDRIVVSLIGRNLLTWTSYSGYDPDIGSPMYRLDSFDYPVYRTLTASVEIVF